MEASRTLDSSSSQATQPSTPPAGSTMTLSGKRHHDDGEVDTDEPSEGPLMPEEDIERSRRKRIRLTDMHPDDLLRKVLQDEISRRHSPPLQPEVTIATGGKQTVLAVLSDMHVEVHLRQTTSADKGVGPVCAMEVTGGGPQEPYIVWHTESDVYPENKDEHELHHGICNSDIFAPGLAMLGDGSETAVNCGVEGDRHPIRVVARSCHTPEEAVSLLCGVSLVECDAPCVHFINRWVLGLAKRLSVDFLPRLADGQYVDYRAVCQQLHHSYGWQWLVGRIQGLLPDQWSVPLGFNSSQLPEVLDRWVETELVPLPSTGNVMNDRANWRLRYTCDMIRFLNFLSKAPVVMGSNFAAFLGGSSGAGVPKGLPLAHPLARSIDGAGRSGQLYYIGFMNVKLAVYMLGYTMGIRSLDISLQQEQKTPSEVMVMAFDQMARFFLCGGTSDPALGACDVPTQEDLELLRDLANGRAANVANLSRLPAAQTTANTLMCDALKKYGQEFGTVCMETVRAKLAPQEAYFTPEKFGKSLRQLVDMLDTDIVGAPVPCEHTDALRALQLAILRGELKGYPDLSGTLSMKQGFLVTDEDKRMNVLTETSPPNTPPQDLISVLWPASSRPVTEWEDALWELIAARLAV